MKTEVKNLRIKIMAICCVFVFIAISTTIASDGKFIFKNLTAATEVDVEPNLEKWMYDLSEWKSTNDDNKKSKTETETESARLVKIAESEYNQNTKRKLVDDEIILEDWMLSAENKFWNSKPETDTAIVEEIELEDWMMDLSKW
jgi:hypothetical protein